jgi:hypothetical protein
VVPNLWAATSGKPRVIPQGTMKLFQGASKIHVTSQQSCYFALLMVSSVILCYITMTNRL